MSKSLIAAAVGALFMSGCMAMDGGGTSATMTAAPVDYTAAVADPLRPAEEVARDPLRKPAEMLAFAEVGPGDRIADIRPGAGYFTRLFARGVGDTGKVYAFVPNRTMARENAPADALVAAYPNVLRVNGALDAMTFPEPLDVIFMSQEYHDFHIPAFNTDVAKMNAAVFAALKPGGIFVVIDHAGRAGTTNTEVQTLHRIDGEFLKAEVVRAGFVFDGESTAVTNPQDDRTVNVFEPVIRGKTDQFVYRFRKPG